MTKIRDVSPKMKGFTIIAQERISPDKTMDREYENVQAYTVGENFLGMHFMDDSEIYVNTRRLNIEFIDVRPIYEKAIKLDEQGAKNEIRPDSQPRIIRPASAE